MTLFSGGGMYTLSFCVAHDARSNAEIKRAVLTDSNNILFINLTRIKIIRGETIARPFVTVYSKYSSAYLAITSKCTRLLAFIVDEFLLPGVGFSSTSGLVSP